MVVCLLRTCAQSEAGLLAHVAEADRDAVPSSGLQPFQLVLHRVVLGGQLVVQLHLADPVPHMNRISLMRRTRKTPKHM